jgi:hypothetical protein
MNPKIDVEVRRARRERELGEKPICVLCGYSNRYGLRKYHKHEKHHIVLWRNDWGLTVILCLNCHAEQTERARDRGLLMQKPETVGEKIAAMLRLLKLFLHSLADAVGRWADELEVESKKGGNHGSERATGTS